MKKIIFSIIVTFAMILGVNAAEKNEVTLNFKNGIIHDGYVEYSKIAKVQLFKDDTLVVDISNNMVIDLNEAEYKFVIDEIEDKSVAGVNMPIKLMINSWYYPISKSIVEGTKPSFKLESSKFSGTLEIKFLRTNIGINTKVEKIYDEISSNGVIDLTNGQEYVIDFSKNDELTVALKLFADLEKTLYYKNENGKLVVTENESEAVIKIVGNKDENKAVITAVNVGNKKIENFKGDIVKYTGAKLQYVGTSEEGIIDEIRTEYYTTCEYDFTFKYAEDIKEPKEYQFIEGANQKYTIDKDSDMAFRIDADYSLFDKKVYIDNELVDVNNYTSKAGSTIIIFNKDYVSTLNVGKHTLKVIFSDNNEALTNFEIIKEEKNEIIKNPETIDNIEKYIAIGIVAVIGIVGSIVLIRKSKEK